MLETAMESTRFEFIPSIQFLSGLSRSVSKSKTCDKA
jgi:hypothetical protein